MSTNCNITYRCVKCGGSHSPGKCDIPPKGDNTEDSLIMNPK